MQEHELRSEIQRVIESNEKTQESLEKAMKQKSNTIYAVLVRILSLAILITSVYAALFVSAASAMVLAGLFLLTWFMYCAAYAAIGAGKAYADGKAKELQTELERNESIRRAANRV